MLGYIHLLLYLLLHYIHLIALMELASSRIQIIHKKNEIDRCRLSYPTVYEGVEISQDPPPPATILGDLH